MNRIVGGTRYVRKIPIPSISPQPRAHRASEYAAGTATRRVMTTTARPTPERVLQVLEKVGVEEQQLQVVQRGGSLKGRGCSTG